MSKQITFTHGWELNNFYVSMVQTGIVEVEGKNILTVYLADNSRVIFHSTLRMILIQNRHGTTNFEFGFSYDPELQQMIWETVPQLRVAKIPKFMDLIRQKYGDQQ